MSKRTHLWAVIAVAALTLTACGNVQEALLEEAVEQAGGNDFDVDFQDDRFTIDSDEGEIQLGTGELPDGFDFDLPDGYEVVTGFRQAKEDKSYYYVQVRYPASDYERVVRDLDDRAWPADVSVSETSGSFVSKSWATQQGDKAVSISLVEDITVLVVNQGLS